MMTPLFPAFRSGLAALGRRTLRSLRQTTLAQLGQQVRALIPDHLLASADEGANSRERDYPLRLTVECFVWQMLNPGTACREVVRQVQALCRLAGRLPVEDNTSAYVQARQRLPQERLLQVLAATAQARGRKVLILARLDLNGPAHRNPPNAPYRPGVRLACPHFHRYVEGFEDKVAYGLPMFPDCPCAI